MGHECLLDKWEELGLTNLPNTEKIEEGERNILGLPKWSKLDLMRPFAQRLFFVCHLDFVSSRVKNYLSQPFSMVVECFGASFEV